MFYISCPCIYLMTSPEFNYISIQDFWDKWQEDNNRNLRKSDTFHETNRVCWNRKKSMLAQKHTRQTFFTWFYFIYNLISSSPDTRNFLLQTTLWLNNNYQTQVTIITITYSSHFFFILDTRNEPVNSQRNFNNR